MPWSRATRGAKGRPRSKRILDNHRIGRTVTKSELEDRFLAILDRNDLPRPLTNEPITLPSGRQPEPDCVWPDHRLIVELDGYDTHATRHAFEQDRARDRELQAEGWRVIRITWRQLQNEPGTIAAQLTRLLAAQRQSEASIA